jgi:hypothetical protein
MTFHCRRRCWLAIGLGATLSWVGGCQTYVPETGQTLPSGYYLHHEPQYFAPTPPFPLPREEAGLEQAQTGNQPNAAGLPPR